MREIRKLKKYIIPAAVFTAAVVLLTVSHIGCPIKFSTGIACPGCGMTRAWESALFLDFHKAMEYHPLFWTLPLIGILILLRKKINRRVYTILIIGFIALFAVVYIARLFDVNDRIVTFNLKDSALLRIVNMIKGGISQW